MTRAALPVDRVDRIVPRVQDRSEQRRREERPRGQQDEQEPRRPAADERERKPAPDDDDDHTIDLLVQGLWLPTRQILPGRSGAQLVH